MRILRTPSKPGAGDPRSLLRRSPLETLTRTLAAAPPWGRAALTVALAVLAGLLVQRLLAWLIRRGAPRLHAAAGGTVVRRARTPSRWALVLSALWLVAPLLPLPDEATAAVRHGLVVALILAVAWLLVALTEVFQVMVKVRFDTDVPDNLRARRVRTKVQLLRRIVVFGVAVVAAALVLMTFEPVRRIGISLFASAGVAGLVVGIAAQPTLSNVIAGLQVALTEPIRLDDVVIVEGEWGRVEEIGITYVVVRIWDERRLVVPLRYFIEQPFQNWTRATAQILGTVFLHVDYRTPVERVREELHRLLEGNEGWDGRAWGLQVTGAGERTIELRALMSARDSGSAWDLRCRVREGLVDFLRREHPECLPRTRAEVDGMGVGRPEGGATGGSPSVPGPVSGTPGSSPP